ncbi:MAG: hypothetical protein H0X26_04035 [Alphaproteobacteria bacterium]|nr:hypothetical protein [Alphaproteobacteria bacterium]
MKIWGVLCFLGIIGELNARVIDVSDKSDVKEERTGVGVSPKDDSIKDSKAEPPSFLRENSESFTSSKEEIEKSEPYVIIVTDKPSAPGGGVPSLDPNTIAEMILPPFAEAEAPWWERWWNGVAAWFSGEDSKTKHSEQP